MNRSERSLAALKKARELMRDSLYLKYGEAWAAHDRSKGMFFAEPSEDAGEAGLHDRGDGGQADHVQGVDRMSPYLCVSCGREYTTNLELKESADPRSPLTADEEREMIALRSLKERTPNIEARFQALKKRWVLWNDAADYAQCECCAISYEQGHKDAWMPAYQEGYTQGVSERPAYDDADRLKALWLFPPADIGFWKVAYPTLEAFRLAIDRWTKEKHSEKWGRPS